MRKYIVILIEKAAVLVWLLLLAAPSIALPSLVFTKPLTVLHAPDGSSALLYSNELCYLRADGVPQIYESFCSPWKDLDAPYSVCSMSKDYGGQRPMQVAMWVLFAVITPALFLFTLRMQWLDRKQRRKLAADTATASISTYPSNSDFTVETTDAETVRLDQQSRNRVLKGLALTAIVIGFILCISLNHRLPRVSAPNAIPQCWIDDSWFFFASYSPLNLTEFRSDASDTAGRYNRQVMIVWAVILPLVCVVAPLVQCCNKLYQRQEEDILRAAHKASKKPFSYSTEGQQVDYGFEAQGALSTAAVAIATGDALSRVLQ